MRVICVLTKADMVDDNIKADTANLEGSVVLHQMRQCVMQKAGLPLNQVRPVALIAAFLLHPKRKSLCAMCPLCLAIASHLS
jgi:hypothetical protein